MAKGKTSKQKPDNGNNLRETITGMTESLLREIRKEELTPMEKLALLRILLPYSVGKLPTAVVNCTLPNIPTLEDRLSSLFNSDNKEGYTAYKHIP